MGQTGQIGASKEKKIKSKKNYNWDYHESSPKNKAAKRFKTENLANLMRNVRGRLSDKKDK